MDLSSLSLLNLTAAVRRGAADLHCGRYNVIGLSSSTLTADCRRNVLRRGGKTAGKQTEPESLVSAEFKHKHTDTHTLRHSGACCDLLGDISLLAILVTL